MALAQVNAGDKINASDINQFYNILKGVAASGESVTLIYNAAGAVILQPSSDPATGTELIQIKNNAGTVQMALSSDGKVYVANGVVGTPSITFEGEKTTGLWWPAASTMALSLGGTEHLRLTTTAMTFAAAATRIVPGATSLSLRNNANGADNLIIVDAGGATFRDVVTILGASLSIGTNPAASGGIRVPNGTAGRINARNSINSTDNALISFSSANKVAIDESQNGSTFGGGITVGGAAGATVIVAGTLTAGGLLGNGFQVATSGPLIYSGSNIPSISAAVKGSLYLRTDGTSGTTRMYVATDTAGTWTAVNTVA